jgi:hypothetical protein
MIEFSSAGSKDALIIFIPILFTVLLGLFALLMPLAFDEDNYLGLTLAAAAITSHLAYRFVIQTMMPSVGYTITTDSVYVFALVILFVCFAFIIIGSYIAATLTQKNAASREEKVLTIQEINLWFVISFIGLLIISVVCLYNFMVL